MNGENFFDHPLRRRRASILPLLWLPGWLGGGFFLGFVRRSGKMDAVILRHHHLFAVVRSVYNYETFFKYFVFVFCLFVNIMDILCILSG